MNHSMNDTVPPSRAAILLVQLGTLDRPEVPEVRHYLREFLSDRRVVEQSPLTLGTLTRIRPCGSS